MAAKMPDKKHPRTITAPGGGSPSRGKRAAKAPLTGSPADEITLKISRPPAAKAPIPQQPTLKIRRPIGAGHGRTGTPADETTVNLGRRTAAGRPGGKLRLSEIPVSPAPKKPEPEPARGMFKPFEPGKPVRASQIDDPRVLDTIRRMRKSDAPTAEQTRETAIPHVPEPPKVAPMLRGPKPRPPTLVPLGERKRESALNIPMDIGPVRKELPRQPSRRPPPPPPRNPAAGPLPHPPGGPQPPNINRFPTPGRPSRAMPPPLPGKPIAQPLPPQRAGTATPPPLPGATAPPPLPHQRAAAAAQRSPIAQPAPASRFEPVMPGKSPLDGLPKPRESQPLYMYGGSPRKSVISTVGRVAVPIAEAPGAEGLQDFTSHLVDFDDEETMVYDPSASYERISVSDLERMPERGSIVVSPGEVHKALRKSRASYIIEANLNAAAGRARGFIRGELCPEIDDIVHTAGKALERHVEPHLNRIAAELQKALGKR